MQPFTLNKAAIASGKAKVTILKDIRNGRLSAFKNDKGRWEIQPAELFRCYPATSKPEPDYQSPVVESKNTDYQLLTQELAFTKQLMKQLEDERDDLRRRLDVESEERRRLSQMLLTHQTEPQTTQPVSILKKWFG